MNSELIIDDVMIECCYWQKKRFGVLPVKSSGAITSPVSDNYYEPIGAGTTISSVVNTLVCWGTVCTYPR